MKKILLSFAIIASSTFAFAQADFNKAMADEIQKLNKTEQADDLGAIAYQFDRLGTQQDSWLTYYYASYAYIKQGKAMLQANKISEIDQIAAVAEKYAMVAQEKKGKSAEIFILFAMIHDLRMMVNPEQRFDSETALGKKYLEQAKQLDPKNPRIAIANAERMYFTPEKFGGSKEKGLVLFQTALDQFKTYKPASSIDPNWGKEEAAYLISESKK